MLVLPQTTKKYGPRDAHTDEGGGKALMAESPPCWPALVET